MGVKGRAKPLSFDHKPQNEGNSHSTLAIQRSNELVPDITFFFLGEKARISAAGGFVDFGRVNGNLALSRAIGDFEFKKSAELSPEQQIVTAYPDVTTHEITEDDEFLVIACDGASISDKSFFYVDNVTDNDDRHLGLPILPISCGVCPKRNCGQARTVPYLREHDGQLPVLKQ